METDRTKNRRELREKRLAYFDKLIPPKPPSVPRYQNQGSQETVEAESSVAPVVGSLSYKEDRTLSSERAHKGRNGTKEGNGIQKLPEAVEVSVIETESSHKESQKIVRPSSSSKRSGRKERKIASLGSQSSQNNKRQHSPLQSSQNSHDANCSTGASIRQGNRKTLPVSRSSVDRRPLQVTDNGISNSGHASDAEMSSHQRYNFTNGRGSVWTGRGSKDSFDNSQPVDMGSGARPKVRPSQRGIVMSSPQRIARKRKEESRDAFHLSGALNNYEAGDRLGIVNSHRGDADEYESFASNRLEIGNVTRHHSGVLEPVSVPTVIHSSHGHYRMGTKEHPPEPVHQDDLYQVFRMERRYDYPRGKDVGRASYEDARRAAAEHNAFEVESMLNEMRHVRRVKSKLHDELRESFDEFGSLSRVLERNKYLCDSAEEEEIRTRDDLEEEHFAQFERREEANAHSEFLGKEESSILSKQSQFNNSTDKNDSDLEVIKLNKDLRSETKRDKNGFVDNAWAGGKKDVTISKETNEGFHDGLVAIRQGTQDSDAEMGGTFLRDDAQDISPLGKNLEITQNDSKYETSTNGENVDEEEEDKFNLGALCEAAKQGDDILKDYIKRLTKRILSKRDDAGTGEDVVVASRSQHEVINFDPSSKEDSLISVVHEDGDQGRPPSRDLHSQLFQETPPSATDEDGETAVYRGQFGHWGSVQTDKQTDAMEVEDVQTGDAEVEEGGDKGKTNEDMRESILGLETHRPVERSHSPLKVISFGGRNGILGSSEVAELEGMISNVNSNHGNSDASQGETCSGYQLNGYLEDGSEFEDTSRRIVKMDNHSNSSDRSGLSTGGNYGPQPDVSVMFPINGSEFRSSTTSNAYFGSGVSPEENTLRDVESLPQSRNLRRPRTPEEHRRGIERHHQWGRRQEQVDVSLDLVPEVKEDVEQQLLSLNLSSIDQSEGDNEDAFITEVSSDWLLNESMNSHEDFEGGMKGHEVEMDNHARTDDDDESMLMRKISDFDPSSNDGIYPVEDRAVTGGGMTSDVEAAGLVNSVFPLEVDTHSNGSFMHQDSYPLEGPKSTSQKRSKNSKTCKVREVAPKVTAARNGQYKSRWPQSSNLIPSRPSRVHQRFGSPERKTEKKLRPASAKVISSQETVGRGQRLRPKSAAAPVKSTKKPDASGDFFKVTSSKMFEGSTYRVSVSGPLTLKLISDSPRESQSLSIWQLLPDEILLNIFSHLRHPDLLRVALVCRGFYRVAMDESLWKHIHLEKKKLTDFHLTQIGLKHPSSVVLTQCQGKDVTENGLRNLFRTCVDSLQELNVSGCTGDMFSGDWVLLHASRCFNLSSVDASWCNVTDNGLNAVSGGAKSLSSVCLNGCQSVSDTGLRSLIDNHSTSLVEFEVFGCIDLSPLTLVRIGDMCKNLRSLNIGQCYKVTHESIFEVIPKLKLLKHLDMRGCKQIRDDCVRRIAKCCKRLETLVMANCTFLSNASMIDIAANLKTIRSLDVSGCKKITNEGVRAVAMCCTKLEALNLSSTSIDRKSISTLASYCSHNLRELKLNCCKDITEASIVKLLKHCKRMETLHLYGVKGLRNLGLLKLQYPCLMYG